MRNKSDVSTIFPVFLKHVTTQYASSVKAIRSDNAPELAFTKLLQAHGIFHQFSCAYTPQQNSVVERKHQHILNVARALLFQSNISLKYWSDCVCTAVFLINRIPSMLLDNKSPYEMLLKRVPDYSFLKSFGCLCYVSTLLKDRHKFSARADRYVFLGYPSGYKCYKVLHLDSNTVSITRNVVFHEDVFPYHDSPASVPASIDPFDCTILPEPIPVVLDTKVSTPRVVPNANSGSRETVPVATGQGRLLGDRPKRHTRAPGYLSQYHCALARSNLELKPSSSSLDSNPDTTPVSYPLSSVLTYSKLQSLYKSYVLSYSIETEPKSFKEVMLSPNFRKATNEELQAMEANKIWTVESLPPGKNVVGCKWVYTIKYNADVTIEHYKARLVAKGFTHRKASISLTRSLRLRS